MWWFQGPHRPEKPPWCGPWRPPSHPQERVVTCEEVFELGLRNRDCVAMQTRSANIEDRGEIPLRRLIKESLRMRPNRLLIGEVREAEALDLLIAMNSGLPSMSTIHANSAREAVVKLCNFAAAGRRKRLGRIRCAHSG